MPLKRAHDGDMETQADSQHPTSALTIQLLSWIASRPRTYAETMEAWRTSCPRMPIWEDAVSNGLVALNGGSTMRDRRVVLTPRGYAVLNTHHAALDGLALIPA